ncbi:MAG: hypothetical protein Q4F95_09660 [Oscillospiraceae bacterium]|nr:hypothetical protein [Oscillospiraceae bacterium]
MIRIKKIVNSIILCLSMMLFSSGCSAALKSEMVSYSRKNFGDANCISYSYTEEKSTAVMEDKQYGFTYTVTSSIDDFNLDGSSFFKYENKYSDFFDKYTRYIMGTQMFGEMLDEYNAEVKFDSAKCVFLKISDTENAVSAAGKLSEIIKDTDTRKYIIGENFVIYISDKNDNPAGEYSLDDSCYSSPEEAEINWILQSAASSIYNLNEYEGSMPDADKFEYMYSEYMDSSDIPGRTAEGYSMRIDDTPESLAHTLVVHFKYKKREWIVADCLGESSYLYVYCLTDK